METNKESAVAIDFIQNHKIPFSIETGLTILFGLKGHNNIQTADLTSVLRADNVFVITPMRLYSISGGRNAGLLRIRISQSVLRLAGCDQSAVLNCIISGESEDRKNRHVKELCAGLFHSWLEKSPETALRGRAMETASFIYENYAEHSSNDQAFTTQNLARVEKVLEELKKNWQSQISLRQIAAEQYVSESYLSRVFRKYTGYGFLECLTEIRLANALDELRYTDKSVTDIALDNGFSNTNSFIAHFRKKYDMTPGSYRRKIRPLDVADDAPKPMDTADWAEAILKYDVTERTAKLRRREIQEKVSLKEGKQISRTWTEILNVGYAADLLLAPVQEQIRRAQKEIGFHYIRFRGMMDDTLHVYHEKSDGTMVCDFRFLDQVFDFVISCGFHPFLEISWVPAKLAREQKSFWDNHAIVSPPKDMEKWQNLLRETICHWVRRYGLREVRQWRFSPVTCTVTEGLPDLWSQEDYLEYYVATYDAVKSVSDQFVFGGCGFFCDSAPDPKRGIGLLDRLKQCGRMPDFLSVDCFAHEVVIYDDKFTLFLTEQSESPSVISADVDYTRHFLDRYRAALTKSGYGSLPVLLETCLISLWQRDLSGDTMFRALWLCKNILENMDRADAFGFSAVSDWFNEIFDPADEFHGGFGLLTTSNIAKSSYRLLQMFNNLGTQLVKRGPGFAVTKNDDDVQIVFYNYCHYEELYRLRYRKLEDPYLAYDVFRNGEQLCFRIILRDLEDGTYRIRTEHLSKSHGSSFDEWLRMGAPKELSEKEAVLLDGKAVPAVTIQQQDVSGELILETELAPLEIKMIILERIMAPLTGTIDH